LIRENLRLTIEERFDRLMRLQILAEELRKSGKGEDEIQRLTFADLKSID